MLSRDHPRIRFRWLSMVGSACRSTSVLLWLTSGIQAVSFLNCGMVHPRHVVFVVPWMRDAALCFLVMKA